MSNRSNVEPNLVFFCLCFRYSDFVVHEINREGKTVQLDDLSIPPEVEVRHHAQTCHT